MLGRKKSAEKLKVVAVRIDPVIERRIRFLGEATGRKLFFFLQQLIEGGISALEEVWLPPICWRRSVLARCRNRPCLTWHETCLTRPPWWTEPACAARVGDPGAWRKRQYPECSDRLKIHGSAPRA